MLNPSRLLLISDRELCEIMSTYVPTKSPPVLFYCVALAALTAETSALFFLSYSANIFPAIALHLGAVALVGFWAYSGYSDNSSESFSLLLLPLTLAIGPFGVALCFIARVVNIFSATTTINPSEWIESLFEHEKECKTERLYEQIILGHHDSKYTDNIEPFRDIITSGTVSQKQMALVKIARYFSPQFAPLLWYATKDSNAAVRVQAATTLANIERIFMMRYMKLESALEAHHGASPEKLKLAEFYDDYAHAGLLDEKSRHDLRIKAISIYRTYLDHHEDRECAIRLSRLYLRQGTPEKALLLLEPLAKSPDTSDHAVHWYMECLYSLHKFDALRAFANSNAQSFGKQAPPGLYIDKIDNLHSIWQNQPSPSVPPMEATRNVA